MAKKKVNIFGRYIFYTNLTIFSLIFLVPLGGYLLTGQKSYISFTHFTLAGIVGILQILVTRIYRRDFQRYWERVKESLYLLGKMLRGIKTLRDIEAFKNQKEEYLKPLLEEENFHTLGESLNELLEEVSEIFESKLFKEELIRRLTTTLNTEKLSNILASNVIRYFEIPAVAIYLKNLRGEGYELKLNKGFEELPPSLGEGFIERLLLVEDILIEEQLDHKIDLGVCSVKASKVYVHKLKPRREKLLGVLFFGVHDNFSENNERKLKNFLSEIEPTLSLIFENAYEHEKSVALASYDPLTGAFNRREGLKILRTLLRKAYAEERNLCILVLDIDHFKKINDTYGHEIGDLVLKEVVRVIKRSIRNEDIVIRWGGEEFLVILNDLPSQKAKDVAERIRRNVENNLIELPNGEKLNVTVSIGVACTQREGTFFFEELFKIADKRLYRAKNTGRNKVVVD